MTRWSYAILIAAGLVVVWVAARVVPRELWHYPLFFLAGVVVHLDQADKGYDDTPWALHAALLLALGAGVLLGRLR
jgi:hypothetical protein